MTPRRAATRFTAVGECMIELRHTGASALALAFAGDTYNSAVYFARAAKALSTDVEVSYVTGVGDDRYSALMRQEWTAEGIIDRSAVIAGAHPGLYIVRTDDFGERSFHYWRKGSAAEQLFATPDFLPNLDGDIVYLSGITLQLLTEPIKDQLLHHLAQLRTRGTTVAFDTNYRRAGWPEPRRARAWIERYCAQADVVLATFSDESILFGDTDPQATGERHRLGGVREVLVKVGLQGSYVFAGERTLHVPAVSVAEVIDTTAAGDSYAGTYLAARAAGGSVLASAAFASEVAAVVVTRPGAIVAPAATMEVYRNERTRARPHKPCAPSAPPKLRP